jgi:hypothetical protein
MTALQQPRELMLRRASRSVRTTCARVSSMCTSRRFRRAQMAMEIGGAMSSPRGGGPMAGGGARRRSSAAVRRAREAEAGEDYL